MKFNLRAAQLEDGLRVAVVGRLMWLDWLRYQLMRSRLAYLPAYRCSGTRKPAGRVAAELLVLALRWRCLPFHYYRYGLYERGIGWRRVLGYLPETVFYYRLLIRLNRDTLLLDDKLVCKRVLGDAGVPQPALLLSGDDRNCFDPTGRAVDPNAPGRLLGDDRLAVIKPARYSSGGDGVTVLVRSGDGFTDRAGTAVSLGRYGARWGPWLIERFVRQNSELAALSERSLNTFRVITTWSPRRGARVEYCVLKLGSGAAVDNAHDGGLYVGVDTVTGALGDVAFDESFHRHVAHPVSGVTFRGYRVAAVRDVVALAERCAVLFPQTNLIGWDIAVDDQGALVIEGNSSPGLTNVQRTHGGVARTLGRRLAEDL